MKPTELFGVVVRTSGLYLVLSGAMYLIYGFLATTEILPATREARSYFMSGVPYVIGGCFLMRGANWFVTFCYPAEDQQDLPSS